MDGAVDGNNVGDDDGFVVGCPVVGVWDGDVDGVADGDVVVLGVGAVGVGDVVVGTAVGSSTRA
jgi:hypothetical protein